MKYDLALVSCGILDLGRNLSGYLEVDGEVTWNMLRWVGRAEERDGVSRLKHGMDAEGCFSLVVFM